MKANTGGVMPQIFRMVSVQGKEKLRLAIVLAVIAGVVRGAALVVFLPAAASLVKNNSVWGLKIGGWLVVLAVLGLLSLILEYRLAMANYDAALDVMKTMHRKIGNKVASLPLGYFTAGTAGEFSRLVTKKMLTLGESFAHMLAPIIMNSMTLLVLLLGCWVWSPAMGALLTLTIPIIILAALISRRCKHRDNLLIGPPANELSARLVEFTQHQPILRACGKAAAFKPLDSAIVKMEKAGVRGMWWGVLGNVAVGISAQLVAILAMILAVSTVFGLRDPIAAIVFIGVILRFTTLLSDIGTLGMGLEVSRPLLAKVNALLDEPVIADPPEPSLITAPGTVELRDVHFGYSSQRSVLNGVSHIFPPCSFTAVVGPSGCGKTTLARLVARFYDAESGDVLVGGVSVKDQRIEDLMKQISWVFQDVYLYDDTLEANIRVGNPQASDAAVQNAADLAGVTEIVERLPEGWNTKVGEGGRALSGGERQRVSIARALLKDAPIVLFDEATSALDPANESHVVQSLNYLRKRATLIVIAHKLSTISAADEIMVLNSQGKIVQTGTHEELLAQGGTYQEFWELRNAAKGWSLT
ncbi:ABC transporter ATP-binding protein [Arcanobacterium hippocoleae]